MTNSPPTGTVLLRGYLHCRRTKDGVRGICRSGHEHSICYWSVYISSYSGDQVEASHFRCKIFK